MEVTEAELNQIHPKSNITYPANIDTNIENQPINNTWMTSGQQASGEDFQEIPWKSLDGTDDSVWADQNGPDRTRPGKTGPGPDRTIEWKWVQ